MKVCVGRNVYHNIDKSDKVTAITHTIAMAWETVQKSTIEMIKIDCFIGKYFKICVLSIRVFE